MPSGEMVAPMIDSFLRDKPRHFPLNLPNTGQCPDLPADAVVEAMCHRRRRRAARAATHATAPPVLAEWLRRVVAVAGDDGRGRGHRRPRQGRSRRCSLDPLAGRIDFDHVEQMTDEMLAATTPLAPAVRVRRDFTRRRARRPRLRRRRRRWRRAAATDAATAIRAAIDERGDANVMLATGNSQLAFLAELVDAHRRRLDARHRVPHGRVRRARRRRTRRASSATCANASPTGCRCSEFHYLDGDTGDPEAEARRYAALLREHPLDLCCCGHRRERPPRVQRPARRRLRRPARREGRRARRPRRAASRSAKATSPTIDDVPTHAITVTIPALLARGARARDRARGAQGRAGARRAGRPDHHRVPGVDPAHASRTRRSTSTPSRPRSSAREDVFAAQRACRTRRTSST